ncbi:hypothetical protein ACQ4PT_037607 [Festuca glaucescens]
MFQMCFGAKRLAKVVQNSMNLANRAIISKTLFKHLLNVASFAAPPMELIEYLVTHTNLKLRDFRHKNMSILFARDMVVKVLGVPSGNRPMVYLKRTQQSELRYLFKNDKGRATIAKAIEVLEQCEDTYEALVVQSFGLIAFATVLCSGIGNLVKSPTNANWPRVDPAVEGDDGMGSEEVDVNPSTSLNEWLEKGFASSQELQVLEHLQGLYKKLQDQYATDVGAALHNFGHFLKASNAKRMAALLLDVHAANVASSSFTIPCPAASDVHAMEPSPIMVEEDVVQNVVTKDALDIGEASHMASKPFVQIGNFFVPYKNFLAVFKPRQYMDNQVMSLFVEKFNIENHMQATRKKRSRKKFAFSVRMTAELMKDPAKFQTKDVNVEFKNACEKYKISKMDMITNFGVLAQENKAFNVDITKLKRGGPTDYPQQPNLFDCGFFTVLYMDKFDGKVMENFDENGIPYFGMILATDFINHPMNTEDSAKVFEEETYESLG